MGNCRCSWIPLTVKQAAARGVTEAKLWLETGREPSPAARVSMPSFQPPPGFQRSLAAAPLSIQLSAEMAIDFVESKHKRDHGQFAKTEGSTDHESILKRYGKKLSAAADKVPLIGHIKRSMTKMMGKIHQTASDRYGPKTASAIMASGTVMDLLLMGGGTAVTGIVAEGRYRLGGKRLSDDVGIGVYLSEIGEELSKDEFDAACKQVAKMILRQFKKLLASVK